MKILVTGAAGFIGSNLVHALNAKGYDQIVAVDDLSDGIKYRNLVDAKILDYLDVDVFYDKLSSGCFGEFDYIFHEGACSDTMELNGKYVLSNNYEISKLLYHYAAKSNAALSYASSAAVYGASTDFRPIKHNEKPLNVYGYSKLLFDNFVRQNGQRSLRQLIGFRYFNVYGPRELHKGRMASVAYHHYRQHQLGKPIKLFGSYGGYDAGEQLRDFIYIDDLVNVKIWAMENVSINGIFNLGTGRAQSFNEVALAVINSFNKMNDCADLNIKDAVVNNRLQYVDFPEELVGKYQSFTQADITDLRKNGYSGQFRDVGQGVSDYMNWLVKDEKKWSS